MARYLDDNQRSALDRLRSTWTWRTEWPTWLLIVTIYGGWFSIATHARVLGLPLAVAWLAVFSAWYLSLQHELLHGHPTRSRIVNALLGFAPLAVWFPYGIYRDAHLRHHDDTHLTHPELDPESYFVADDTWRNAGAPLRALLLARNTFVGRLLLGPAFSIAATATHALRKIAAGDLRDVPAWLAHGVALGALIVWLDRFCGISAWLFVIGVGYPSLSIASVRSFHEHRLADTREHRTVINEAGVLWRLLFLNNNYHLVHHDLPHVPWFALRRVYEASREEYVARSGGFVVKGYGEWMKRHAFAQVAHPMHGGPSGVTSGSFVGKSREELLAIVRRGDLREARVRVHAEGNTTRER